MLQLALQLIGLQILFLLVMRPLLLWYLKVNQALSLLRSIDSSLKCLPAVMRKNENLRRAG